MSTMKKEAQLVFIPIPGVGHLLSTIEFAKLLINRDSRLWVTVFVMKSPFDTNTAAYTHSLSSSERIHVINLPEYPSKAELGGPSQLNLLLQYQKPHVREAVSNLTASESAPPLAAFVLDMFSTTMIDIAKEFGVPSLVFFTSGVAFLGSMLHLYTLRERNQTQFREQQTESIIPSFANPVPSTALPSFVVAEEWDTVFLAYGSGLKRADGIIVNSFEELESHAVHSLSDAAALPPVYPVGPLLNPNNGEGESEKEILSWLDHQPPSSVVFLCFGSMGSFPEDQVREIALALENSGARFLWSLRKPPPKGAMLVPSDYTESDLDALLPPGFLDRTADVGKVIGWAPQAQILGHRATAGFVSHCGWNSTLESIYYGVPIAAWPLYAEQQTNAFELVCELKMAVEVALDYRVEFMVGPNILVSAERIEKGIRSLLNVDQDIRNRVKETSEKSRKTLLPEFKQALRLQPNTILKRYIM
ncbi:UDP-glycosyltransferase 71A15-like [Abrus precatorius]|uniref:Glycosyltransferase n=1 Tax=Abrus precatorius TaxID=3816 RepID=A0A8B8JJL2_ABRPR|nr:UDP-glycosyltransferase 71A15-like [Abrus precatorius]